MDPTKRTTRVEVVLHPQGCGQNLPCLFVHKWDQAVAIFPLEMALEMETLLWEDDWWGLSGSTALESERSRARHREELCNCYAIQSEQGFPGGSDGKESSCNAGDLGSIPGLERSPGEGKGYPLQYSGLENSVDCVVHRGAKSRTWLSDFHFTVITKALLEPKGRELEMEWPFRDISKRWGLPSLHSLWH